MIPRRLVLAACLVATAASFFTLGVIHSRRVDLASRAIYDAKLDAIRAEVRTEIGETRRIRKSVV